MSTINNIPFDINRTPVERNAPLKRSAMEPVQQSESIHPTDKQVRITERRGGENRRKREKVIKLNKRLLGERRLIPLSAESKATTSDNAHSSGSIIDLEV